MAPVLYRCPNTGDNVQAWVADDPDDDDHTYVQGHTEQGNRAVTVAKIRYRARWACVVGQGVDRSTPARWIVPSKNLKDPGPSKFSGVPSRPKNLTSLSRNFPMTPIERWMLMLFDPRSATHRSIKTDNPPGA